MTWPAAITLATLVVVLVVLATSRFAADWVLMAALTFLLGVGVLTPMAALEGFANPGVITIAALFVVAAGLKETGAVQWIAQAILGRPASVRGALWRLLLPTGLLSSLMNNTTVVAMFIPAVQEWGRRAQIPASKLLLPLSYMTILGGTCTLIGTSTNLVVDGLLQSSREVHLGLFDLVWVGLPMLLTGGCFMVLCADRLLPDRGGVDEDLALVRQYGVEVEVEAAGPLVNKTVAQAGLRNLNFGYLAEIERQGNLLSGIEPGQVLDAGDRLYFIGAPECASELRRIHGLKPASGSVHKLELANHQRCLVEVVIGPDFPALGQTIKQSLFRTRFNAVILSVSRGGRRVPGKLGNISLKTGDTLLLETSLQFVEQYRFRRDFLLVSALNDSTPPDFSKSPVALVILLLMVAVSASGLLLLLEAALLAAAGMLLTGCLTSSRARASLDLSVLVVIAASFALGQALTSSGAAQLLAGGLLGWAGASPWLALLLVYVLTSTFTEVITNNAAAVLMFPISLSLSEQLGVGFMPFAMAVMFAASASFVTPLGYQTNLMVYGPGRYRFSDYIRLGLPLNLLTAAVAVIMIPIVWPF